MGDTDRSQTVAELRRDKKTGDRTTRKQAAKALDKIAVQDGSKVIRDARSQLVDAYKSGDKKKRKQVDHDLAKLQGQLDSGATRAGTYSGVGRAKLGCDACGQRRGRYTYVKGKGLLCPDCLRKHG